MTQLIIFTRSAQEQPELGPDDVFKLDRKFLTGADDDERYSALHPPVLFYGAGSWYVNNDEKSSQTLYLWGPSGRMAMIEEGQAKKLEEGESDMRIADSEVTLLVTRVARQSAPARTGPITWTPDSAAEAELRRLMKERPVFRAAVHARFQEYIAPPPHVARPALVKRPEPLTAAEAAACCGPEVNDVAMNEGIRLIRGITGLPLWQIGGWLVRRGILRPEHYAAIPHAACGHRPRPPRR